MANPDIKKKLNQIINDFNFQCTKKYKLVILMGLLGDFDSIEYGINLTKFMNSDPKAKFLDIFIVAIGNSAGKEKFCKFTGLPEKYLKIVESNQIQTHLGGSKGLDIGFGGWINMLLMLVGIGSPKTLREVFRGYTGDRNSKEIYKGNDQINLFNFFKFEGNTFKRAFGNGYLRPFELATFRLINMIEIINNWNDYILNSKYLPQRVATYLIDYKDTIIYEYISKDILNYSQKMSDPLEFLHRNLKNE